MDQFDVEAASHRAFPQALPRAPIFRGKLNAPKTARIEPFDPNLSGLGGSGLAHPYDLEVSCMVAIEGVNREYLAHRILSGGFE